MRVREGIMSSSRFGGRLAALLPVCGENQSDSASLDNALELLTLAGRPLAHGVAMLIPEAWEGHATMPDDRRAFYEYHASLMEPWDGPAAVAFTDGRQIAAMLDRNGLRPARYVVTSDDFVVLASEAGALTIPVENIRAKGRLEPGKMLVVNTTQGRILDDEAIKMELAAVRPYRRWVSEQRIDLANRVAERGKELQLREEQGGRSEVLGARVEVEAHRDDFVPLEVRQRAFGYTVDEIKMVLGPMGDAGEEPAGSMGNDTPLAVLSRRPQLLFSYFRQMFAQVTNPAIDPIREQLVMSLAMNLGPQGNLLEETAEQAKQIRITQPVLSEAAMDALLGVTDPTLRAITLPALFLVAGGVDALAIAVDELCHAAAEVVAAGCGVLVPCDREMSPDETPIPVAL